VVLGLNRSGERSKPVHRVADDPACLHHRVPSQLSVSISLCKRWKDGVDIFFGSNLVLNECHQLG